MSLDFTGKPIWRPNVTGPDYDDRLALAEADMGALLADRDMFLRRLARKLRLTTATLAYIVNPTSYVTVPGISIAVDLEADVEWSCVAVCIAAMGDGGDAGLARLVLGGTPDVEMQDVQTNVGPSQTTIMGAANGIVAGSYVLRLEGQRVDDPVYFGGAAIMVAGFFASLEV